MSFVMTQPGEIHSAAGSLEAIGSALSAQNAAAAMPTTQVLPPGADEVSILTAAQFSQHAQHFQQVWARAQEIHAEMVQALHQTSGSYLDTEIANAIAAG